jgi:glycerate 2-kinase
VDLRILLAPDKFKGTLDATAVAGAMALGARDAIPGAEISTRPLADGGEGSLDCVAASTRGSFTTIAAEDAFGEPVAARVFDDGAVAMVAAHETQRLPARPTAPASLRASSRGTGAALIAAARLSPGRDVVVWVGGTASTDGGAGAAQSAGWRLLDARGRDLAPGGASLRSLARIEPAASPFEAWVAAACDVANPLLGERGAARTFAPQKGAGPAEVRVLEEGLAVLAERIRIDLGIDVAALPHAGAGGGLGAGLLAFFGARLEKGFDRMAQATGLRSLVDRADVVVTGEGRVDAGTLEGKVTFEVARRCADAGKPCLVIAGDVALPASLLPAERALGAAGVTSLVDRRGRKASFESAAASVRSVTAEVLRERFAPG